jgi:hypothetical protein
MTSNSFAHNGGRVSFSPDVLMADRAAIEREWLSIKGPTNPKSDKIRMPRPYSTPKKGATLEELRRVLARAGRDADRCDAALYKRVGPDFHIAQTDGSAAILAPVSERTIQTGGNYDSLFVAPDAPNAIVLTPDFWHAYSRVRTCRADRTRDNAPHVRIESGPDGVILRSGDLERDGFEASERISDAPGETFTIAIADLYLWPLRGATGRVRQTKTDGVCWLALDGLEPVIVQPVRLEARSAHAAAA